MPTSTDIFQHGVENLDDVTMTIMALKMPRNGRLYYYGRAPDGEQCEARLLAETHRLSLALGPSADPGKPATVTAIDLYGNASEPSEPIKLP